MSLKERLRAFMPPPWRKKTPVVPVIRLAGVIAPGRGGFRPMLNLESLAPVIEAAFADKRAPAVALEINSPGGSPVQSDLIGRRIRALADEKKKPVVAFCEDVAASGGYWLALAADEIFANPNSIVGSIGVISSGFGFDRAIDKLGIDRRLHTAGEEKSLLDPFRPEDPRDVERLKEIQAAMHESFKAWVRDRRGPKLRPGEVDVFTGAFWTGARAAELGLVDGLGDLRTVMRGRYGEEVRLRRVGARRPLLSRLGIGTLADDALAAVEERAAWSRFGM